jgi:hypothetical protein
MVNYMMVHFSPYYVNVPPAGELAGLGQPLHDLQAEVEGNSSRHDSY